MGGQKFIHRRGPGRGFPFLAEDSVIGLGLGDVDLGHGAEALFARIGEDRGGDLGGVDDGRLAVRGRRQELQGRAVGDAHALLSLARSAVQKFLHLGIYEVVHPAEHLHIAGGIVGDRAVAEAAEDVAGDHEMGIILPGHGA